MSLSKQQLISAPIAGNRPPLYASLFVCLLFSPSLLAVLFAIFFLSSYLLHWLSFCGCPLVFTLAAADSNELFYTRPCVHARLHVLLAHVQCEHILCQHIACLSIIRCDSTAPAPAQPQPQPPATTTTTVKSKSCSN